MNIAVAIDDVRQEALPSASEAGPAPKRIVVAYGFWVFLLSDIVMFSALFAAYAVLARATAGGPTGAQLFNQVSVAIETACLLVSSYTCGMMSLAVNARRRVDTYFFAVVTFALGAAFLYLEVSEFADMIARGATPQRSAFLSAFFTLVGCHGLHVTAGLLWELTRHLLGWYYGTMSQVRVVYGSLTTAILALLSVEIGAILLLLGAQVIAEYERLATEPLSQPPGELRTD